MGDWYADTMSVLDTEVLVLIVQPSAGELS